MNCFPPLFVAVPPELKCKTPNCYRQRYLGRDGTYFDYCGKTCRDSHQLQASGVLVDVNAYNNSPFLFFALLLQHQVHLLEPQLLFALFQGACYPPMVSILSVGSLMQSKQWEKVTTPTYNDSAMHR